MDLCEALKKGTYKWISYNEGCQHLSIQFALLPVLVQHMMVASKEVGRGGWVGGCGKYLDGWGIKESQVDTLLVWTEDMGPVYALIQKFGCERLGEDYLEGGVLVRLKIMFEEHRRVISLPGA
eukprot:1158195-Pelagomonas_calceolata.AAC.3